MIPIVFAMVLVGGCAHSDRQDLDLMQVQLVDALAQHLQELPDALEADAIVFWKAPGSGSFDSIQRGGVKDGRSWSVDIYRYAELDTYDIAYVVVYWRAATGIVTLSPGSWRYRDGVWRRESLFDPLSGTG